jgi:hypothetical protein
MVLKKRWFHRYQQSLNPAFQKTQWTDEEDFKLQAAVVRSNIRNWQVETPNP